jgi:phenylacetate-coenzyme A ligase PaaK-like adenylate-forming protein
VYREYCDAIHVKTEQVTRLLHIPFLPIQFFKTKRVTCGAFEPGIIFESSGTTGSVISKHLVKDISLYEKSFLKTFDLFYGKPADHCIIGLLPSYLERKHSSLVFMVNELVKQSNHIESGFYLDDLERLQQVLVKLENNRQPVLLIGVSYALLDFADKFPMKMQYTTVMETGGMKGRRKELTREEIHSRLKQQFGITAVHSEYGMTELLSQAYSSQSGIFHCPPWMKIMLRSEDDPFEIFTSGSLTRKFAGGAANIIDLANLYSCSFIATDDLGKLYNDGSFEILGLWFDDRMITLFLS